MDNLFAIGLGLGLRAFIDAYAVDDYKVSGTLVGLWEGAVLSHFLDKRPRSTYPYFALGIRLLIDLLVTESFTRFTIVMIWAGLGLVFTDLLSNIWYDGGLRKLFRRLTGSRRSRTSSSSLSSSHRRRPSSASYSSLPFPFFKSLTSSRVHFYEITEPSVRTGSNSVGSSGSQSGSDSTMRSPRSILRSPSSSTIEPPGPRRLRSDLFPGSWSETETITDAGLLNRDARSPAASSSGSLPVIREVSAMREAPVVREPLAPFVTVSRHASVIPGVVRSPTEISPRQSGFGASPVSSLSGSRRPSLAQPAVVRDPLLFASPPRSRAASSVPAALARAPSDDDYRVGSGMEDDDYRVDSGMENEGLTSPSESSSTGFPAISQVMPPPNRRRAPTADSDDLGYVDGGHRSPRSVPSSVPPIMLPPLRGTGSGFNLPTPAALPDLHDIPEISLPTPGANPSQPSLLPPSPSAIPDMTPGETTSVRQLGHEASASTLNERPPSGPPPYLLAEAPPAWPEPFLPLTDLQEKVNPAAPRSGSRGKNRAERESVFSASTSVLMHDADGLWAAAQEKEKEAKRLEGEVKKATREKRFHDALKYKVQKEEADEEARRARERAEQKVYRANNRKLSENQIDVHGLRATEAARRTEKAIAESYERGDMELVVIVGPIEKGQASVKSTIQKTLRDYKITFRDDPDNANQILVSLPSPAII